MKRKWFFLVLLTIAVLILGIPGATLVGSDAQLGPLVPVGSERLPLRAPNALQRQTALDLGTLTGRADLILIGSAGSVSSRYATNAYQDELILSDVAIEPQEVLKGRALQNAETVVLRNQVGGTVGDLTMASSSSPFFVQGQKSVLFLEQGQGSLQVIEGDAGKFDVDDAGQVPELGWSLEQLRVEILSYLTGSRIHLPLIVNEGESSASASGPAQLQADEDLKPSYVTTGTKWPGSSPVVEFLIHNPGFNDAAAGTVAQQRLAISHGASAWGWQAKVNFRFSGFASTTTNRNANDGRNVIIVRDAVGGSPGTLATAYWWYRGGRTIDCDIIFWDRNHNFSVTGAAGTYDIQAIAVHESGHCAGLDHPPGISGASMFATAFSGTTFGRTLHLDDMNGIKSLYGTRMIWDEQTPAGSNESGDLFGSALAVGELDRDEFWEPDLVVGAPGENLGAGPNTGAAYLFYGTRYGNPRLLTQVGAGVNEPGDRFGAALAVADLNSDNWVDLVVGAPGENYAGSGPNAGMVFLFSISAGGIGSPVLVRQNPASNHEGGDLYGTTLAAGDFDNDGHNDLVVGAPGEAIGGSGSNAGAVFYYLGTGSGLGSARMLTQTGAGANESNDRFGSALAVGDFDGDGFDDLAVGAPGENYAGSGPNAGVVFVFFGSGTGLGRPVVLSQSPAGRNESGDTFGSALAAGHFDADSYDDLAVGAPGEDYYGSGPNAGAVFVFAGSRAGLGHPYVFGQEGAGLNESGDRFGATLAVADVSADGFDELIIGAHGEDYLGSGSRAGVVFVRQFSDDSGGTRDFMMVFGQNPAGANEAGDRFGSALAVVGNDFSGDEVVIGAPGEALDGSGANAGVFFYWD